MFTNGDFEGGTNPDGGPIGWTYSDQFVQVAPYGVGGSNCAQIRTHRPDSLDNGGILQEVSVIPGADVTLTYYLWGFFTAGTLEVGWTDTAPTDPLTVWNSIRSIDASEIAGAVEPLPFSDVFTPTSSPIYVRWQTTGLSNSSFWWLDDGSGSQVIPEIDMSVMLGEFVVPAVLKTLQDYLATEVAAINKERNDSEVQISAIQRWYCFYRLNADPDLNECEVYIPAEGLTFPLFDKQMSRWAAGALRTNLDSNAIVVIAINHANRGGASGDTLKTSDLMKRSWRYSAAVLRVLRNYPHLGYQNKLICVPIRVNTDLVRETSQDMRLVRRLEVTISVRLQEDSVGEDTVGGGVPPAAVLES